MPPAYLEMFAHSFRVSDAVDGVLEHVHQVAAGHLGRSVPALNRVGVAHHQRWDMSQYVSRAARMSSPWMPRARMNMYWGLRRCRLRRGSGFWRGYRCRSSRTCSRKVVFDRPRPDGVLGDERDDLRGDTIDRPRRSHRLVKVSGVSLVHVDTTRRAARVSVRVLCDQRRADVRCRHVQLLRALHRGCTCRPMRRTLTPVRPLACRGDAR
jgi:hypothetical protein